MEVSYIILCRADCLYPVANKTVCYDVQHILSFLSGKLF